MSTLSNNFLFQNYETVNYLLKKDDIGKRKEFTFTLPGQDHAYGNASNTDRENAR